MLKFKLIILVNLIILIRFVKLELKEFKCTKNDLDNFKQDMKYMIMRDDHVYIFLKKRYLYFKIPVCFYKYENSRCYVRKIYVYDFTDYRTRFDIVGHIYQNTGSIKTFEVSKSHAVYEMDLVSSVSDQSIKLTWFFYDLSIFNERIFRIMSVTDYSKSVVSFSMQKDKSITDLEYCYGNTLKNKPLECKVFPTNKLTKFMAYYIYDSPSYVDNMTDNGNAIMTIDPEIESINLYFVYYPYGHPLNQTPPYHLTFTLNDFFNCHQEDIEHLDENQVQGIVYDYEAKLFFLFINRYYIIIEDDLIETRFRLEKRYNQLEKHDFEYDKTNIEHLIVYEYGYRKWVRHFIGSNYLTINLHTNFRITYNAEIKKLHFEHINNQPPYTHPIYIKLVHLCYGADFVIHRIGFCFQEEFYYYTYHNETKYRIDDLFKSTRIIYDSPDNTQKFRFIFDLLIDNRFVIFTRTHFFIINYDSIELIETTYRDIAIFQLRIKPSESNRVRKEVNCFYIACRSTTLPPEVHTKATTKKEFTTELTTERTIDVDDEFETGKEKDKTSKITEESTDEPIRRKTTKKSVIELDSKKVIFASSILLILILICTFISLFFFNRSKSKRRSKNYKKSNKTSSKKFRVRKF